MRKYDLHTPVLIHEIIETFAPKNGGVYVDCTFGAGGYSERFLEAADCKIIAFDQDETVIKFADEFSKKYGERFEFFNEPFSNIGEILAGREKVDGIIFDIGVSSMQIDQEDRGFSFRFDNAPLDMRMSSRAHYTAEKILKSFGAKELADIFFQFGEEKNSYRIANRVVSTRMKTPLKTTKDFVDVIVSVLGEFKSKASVQRCFQALRIFINDELAELEKALEASKSLIKPGGVLGVVSFHSLEDRIVKNFLKENSNMKDAGNRYSPSALLGEDNFCFKILDKKGIIASDDELHFNPRSHSARFRFGIKN